MDVPKDKELQKKLREVTVSALCSRPCEYIAEDDFVHTALLKLSKLRIYSLPVVSATFEQSTYTSRICSSIFRAMTNERHFCAWPYLIYYDALDRRLCGHARHNDVRHGQRIRGRELERNRIHRARPQVSRSTFPPSIIDGG
jgi:hypothetical protein